MILVTGGAGFIGSNFIHNWFSNSEEPIIALDKLTYAGNLGNLEVLKGKSNFRFVRADISNKKSIKKLLNDEKPRAVVNFAAESHVDRSILSPRPFFETNVMGTLDFLESCKEYWEGMFEKEKKEFVFLHISTDKVYGALQKGEDSFVEANRLKPNSPYAASKASSDHIVRSYYKTYNFTSIISNCSNNFGPFQYPEKLIPLTVLNLISGKKVPVYGDGKQIRDWLYVTDHCAALELILKKGKVGEIYNVGANNERKNIEVIKTICNKLEEILPNKSNSGYVQQIEFIEDRLGHDRRYSINSQKIQDELGWKPLTSFDLGLEKTINWYIRNREWLENITNTDYKKWILKQYS
jgi:dTDP-glucose 4,6-dehydratase